jgi:hypothetical protein
MTETAFPVIDSHVHLFLSTPIMNPEKWSGRLTAEQAALMRQRFEHIPSPLPGM